MTMTQFIQDNRNELDVFIQKKAPGSPCNDTERELWITNDEALYRWAIACDVYLAT